MPAQPNSNSSARPPLFNLFNQTRWGMVFMLAILHIALFQDAASIYTRVWFVAHFVCFLLWQPLWRGEKRLTVKTIGVLVAFALVAMLWLNWWMVALWLCALAGLMSGKVFLFRGRWQRIFYLFSVLYVLILLLTWVGPQLFGDYVAILSKELIYVLQFELPFLLLVLIVLPIEIEREDDLQVVDFFYSFTSFLLLMLLMLGCFTLKIVSEREYFIALGYTLFIIVTIILALNWIWSPRAGFAGLQVFFSRYLLTVGMPFEEWLQQLAALAERESEPEALMDSAFHAMVDLPWIKGGTWQIDDTRGVLGEKSRYPIHFMHHGIEFTLYPRGVSTPALTLHFKLMTQLLSEFYLAKQREKKMRENAYVQAIHETGSRITHDVKNLLQSLRALCTAAESNESTNAADFQALMQRQLPAITKRLQFALNKLQRPGDETVELSGLGDLWQHLKRRYASDNIEFNEEQINEDLKLPKDLFDSVADNLLQNALRKRKTQSSLKITVTLTTSPQLTLRVCDDGQAIAPQLEKSLFNSPVSSSEGYGIGLYQIARQANQFGYHLSVSQNEPGKVCFELSANV